MLSDTPQHPPRTIAGQTVNWLTAIVIVSAAYIGAQMMADIASLKIVVLFGLAMDGGTFIYPITFTLRDMVHKLAGAHLARVLIITAAVINIIMAALFWLVNALPADPLTGPQAEFGILALAWRIVAASILAEVISELLDTEIYQLWVTRVTTRHQWARVLVSNAVAVPLDSLIFAWVAFGGALPAIVVWQIVAANILVKGATTLVSIPGIYLVREGPPTNDR